MPLSSESEVLKKKFEGRLESVKEFYIKKPNKREMEAQSIRETT